MNRSFTKWLLRTLACASIMLSCTAVAHVGAAATDANPRYDPLVDAVIKHYRLPGIAVGVIENGKVVYRRTHGKLASGKPIDADSLFDVGSTTKAMTVSVLARLVQQGKLEWDAPVTRYLPDFRMYDPWVTKNMQVGDLLTHHSGLHAFAGDLMLWPHPSRFTPRDVVKALRYLKPAYSFRAGYAYDNVLYVTAGELAARVGGAAYATLLRREVFQPLGMQRCQVGSWSRAAVGNVAPPHVRRDGHFVALDLDATREATTMDAAGGVSCSLDDMLTWAQNWLLPTSTQLAWLSAQQRQQEWTPRTPVPISQRRRAWDRTWIFSNGYGWRISNADGEMTVWHTGVVKGMRAAVMLVPASNSGFVVLINASADDALAVIDEVLLKQLVAPDRAHTVAWYADSLKQHQTPELLPVPDTSSRQPATSRELAAWLGVWQDPWFGKVRICPRGDDVVFASLMSPLLSGRVMRVDDRFLVQWTGDHPDAWLTWPAHDDGTLRMALVDPNGDASSDFPDLAFARAGSCQ